MDESVVNGVAQLPEEMIRFIVQHANSLQPGPRLSELALRGRAPVNTPHYVATTSRGVIPHLSHDTLQKHTGINTVYVGLEDFIEKSVQKAPIFQTPTTNGESPLRRYASLPNQCLSILGPRRVPRIACPAQNTNEALAVSTSVGFNFIKANDYVEATTKLRPDISTSVVDLVTAEKASVKRVEKSADRSHAWLRDTIGSGNVDEMPLFASIPPLEAGQQSFYLADLADDFKAALSGICTFSPDTATILPKQILHFPRLCLDDPPTPQAILRAISLGVDLITVPFVTTSSEYGLAFTFEFPSPTSHYSSEAESQPQPLALALDMWSPIHATDTSPLTPNCTCYTCTRHHRAYINHLLSAKEMLAWTLLQIHNFHVLDGFFTAIRSGIADDTFEEDVALFTKRYDSVLPATTGEGPRVRGYQMKSVGGGEEKKNKRVWGRLDEHVEKMRESGAETEESGFPTPDADVGVEELERLGLGVSVGGKSEVRNETK